MTEVVAPEYQYAPRALINMKIYTSVMIYHREASLSKQHADLPIGHCTKQGLSRTSRYADKSSPEIARYRIPMQTARAATLSVATYA